MGVVTLSSLDICIVEQVLVLKHQQWQKRWALSFSSSLLTSPTTQSYWSGNTIIAGFSAYLIREMFKILQSVTSVRYQLSRPNRSTGITQASTMEPVDRTYRCLEAVVRFRVCALNLNWMQCLGYRCHPSEQVASSHLSLFSFRKFTDRKSSALES